MDHHPEWSNVYSRVTIDLTTHEAGGISRLDFELAEKMNGIPQNAINEVLLNIGTTAHILGGCAIGADARTGVIDGQNRVYGYKGMYIVDGSMIPANLGVNPSLTITAMAEHAMSHIPSKEEET